jgi:hypothetical protein
VLDLRALSEPLADVHVVQGLAVLVKKVRVALSLGQANHLVEVDEAGLGRERLEGLDLREFVEVARGDDACAGILGEDGGSKVLRRKR